ncbi:hypothetical protein AKJ16_DCAP22124 [Drosera capensis]
MEVVREMEVVEAMVKEAAKMVAEAAVREVEEVMVTEAAKAMVKEVMEAMAKEAAKMVEEVAEEMEGMVWEEVVLADGCRNNPGELVVSHIKMFQALHIAYARRQKNPKSSTSVSRLISGGRQPDI